MPKNFDTWNILKKELNDIDAAELPLFQEGVAGYGRQGYRYPHRHFKTVLKPFDLHGSSNP